MLWLFCILTAILLFVIFYNTNNKNKEYFDPPPKDIDENSCLGSAYEVKRMVLENQGQFEKQQRTFDKEKDKLTRELKLGQNPPTSVFLGLNLTTFPFGYTCNGRGNYISSIGGWSRHHGSIGGPAGYGKRHHVLTGLQVTCANGKKSPVLGWANGQYWRGTCKGGYNGIDLKVDMERRFPYGIIARCITGGSTVSPNRVADKYTRLPDTIGYDCPSGTVLKGIWGHKAESIADLKFQCVPLDYLPGDWKSVEDYYKGKGNPRPKKGSVPLNTLPCQYCMSRITDDMTNDEKIQIAEDCANEVIEYVVAESKKEYEQSLKKKDEEDAILAATKGIKGAAKAPVEVDVIELAKRKREEERATSRSRILIGGGVSMLSMCFLIAAGVGIFLLSSSGGKKVGRRIR